VALITGASGGLGAAIAARLAAAGYAVGLLGRDSARLETVRQAVVAAGGTALAASADVTRPGELDAACAAVERELGPVEVLVNGAGVSAEFAPVTRVDPDVWWHTIEVNLRGPALLAGRLVPGMVERGHGYVVTLASSAAFWDDDGTATSYAVSKAAAMRFTRSLASEVTGSGVVVLDVSPGLVRTEMTMRLPGYDAIPAERFTPVEQVAELVLHLVSGDHDDLHGRFVHARDDLAGLTGLIAHSPRARTLGLITGPGDPLAN
jgi:NAD(P)-dependent dehydrogenase (short-subunit alcohol dehydrogenase family)